MAAPALNRFGLAALLAAAVLAQGALAWSYRGVRPALGVVDPPPSKSVAKALAFGDDAFLYRYWALDLQNDGDTGGRATPMRDYNYDFVLAWLERLRELDPRGQHHTYLAARYFSQTQSLSDIRRLVDFICADVKSDPQGKWIWLTQAMEIAEHKLKDPAYALAIAMDLASYNYPGQPSWTWLFPAVLLQKSGKNAEAREWIGRVEREKADLLEPETHSWMKHFLEQLPGS